MKHCVRYRLEIDYLSKDYETWALCTDSPIYTKKQGTKRYKAAIKEKCVDDPTIPARVWFWKYNYTDGKFDPITIAKNY